MSARANQTDKQKRSVAGGGSEESSAAKRARENAPTVQETQTNTTEDGEIANDVTNDDNMQIENAVEDHVAAGPRVERQMAGDGALAIQSALGKIPMLNDMNEIASFITALENSNRSCVGMTAKHVRTRMSKQAYHYLQVHSVWYIKDIETTPLDVLISYLKEIKGMVGKEEHSSVDAALMKFEPRTLLNCVGDSIKGESQMYSALYNLKELVQHHEEARVMG